MRFQKDIRRTVLKAIRFRRLQRGFVRVLRLPGALQEGFRGFQMHFRGISGGSKGLQDVSDCLRLRIPQL